MCVCVCVCFWVRREVVVVVERRGEEEGDREGFMYIYVFFCVCEGLVVCGRKKIFHDDGM